MASGLYKDKCESINVLSIMDILGKNYYMSVCGMHFALGTISLLKSKDLWLKQIVRAKFIYISELKVCQDKS